MTRRECGAPALTVALAGNPNVGKSTVFNGLTGLHQHTGNWTGKTVDLAEGVAVLEGETIRLIDLPGTYSLSARSAEEEVARDFLAAGAYDVAVVVCDATCLERNLILALQIIEVAPRTVVCVNLLDEAKRKGITVDLAALSRALGVPVVGVVARRRRTLSAMLYSIRQAAARPAAPRTVSDGEVTEDRAAVAHLHRAAEIAASAVKMPSDAHRGDRRLDRLLTGRWTAYPFMLLLLALVFFITIVGANTPSEWLSSLFAWLGAHLRAGLEAIHAPPFAVGLLVDGIYGVLSTVVAVMLPPMAIFFPLFTLLEDVGYLPRIAYNLDRPFCRCKACGKQALTLCMGFGCNAAGVTGCRIIDSPRERLLAILTNSFVPCNGRFPTMIAVITVFLAGTAAGLGATLTVSLLLSLFIVLGVVMTLIATRLLSATLLRGTSSAFTLELPPYRPPQVGKILVRSLLDRTVFVLGRAAAVAAPAGLLIFLLANVRAGGVSLLAHAAGFLDPAGRILGLDGAILLGFILGFPANEIVLPITMMVYLAAGTVPSMGSAAEIGGLLAANGWTAVTAVCFILFSLMHWPCSTTVLTVKKETGSRRWTAVAVLLPTLFGIVACLLANGLAHLLGLA